MTISMAQDPAAFDDATSGSFASDVTSGNTVFLIVNAYAVSNVTISTSSPTLGGSSVSGATKLKEEQSAWDGTLTAYTATWMLPNCPGGSKAVAITLTNGSVNSATGLWAYEVSGLGTSPSLDKSAAASATSGTASSGASGDITESPEIIFGSTAQNSPSDPLAQPEGFSGPAALSASITGYQIATSSGGSYTYDQSEGGDEWAATVVTVAPGSGGTPHTATASLTVTPSFSAARTRGTYRTGALTVTPSFSAARTRGKYRTAALTVTPSLSATRVRGRYRTAALAVAAAFSAARTRGHYRTASLTVTPQFAAGTTAATIATLTAGDGPSAVLTATDGPAAILTAGTTP